MTDQEAPLVENALRRCQRCMAFSRLTLTLSILDSRSGNMVGLYQCAACGERLWDDGSTLRRGGLNERARSWNTRPGGFHQG